MPFNYNYYIATIDSIDIRHMRHSSFYVFVSLDILSLSRRDIRRLQIQQYVDRKVTWSQCWGTTDFFFLLSVKINSICSIYGCMQDSDNITQIEMKDAIPAVIMSYHGMSGMGGWSRAPFSVGCSLPSHGLQSTGGQHLGCLLLFRGFTVANRLIETKLYKAINLIFH